MPITLFCLVKGDKTVNAFEIDIEEDKSVSKLKDAIKAKNAQTFAGVDAKDLKLWKVEISGDFDNQLRNLTLNDGDELLAIEDIRYYWTKEPPKRHIHVIVKLPLLSLEEALSCIPPSITYSPKCTRSKTTTKVTGDPPTRVMLWDDFFDKVNRFRFDQQPRFERPTFVVKEIINEEDVRSILDFNICQMLNDFIGPEHNFSRLQTHTPGIPDFNCHLVDSLILVIEAKRKHVLEGMGEKTFPEFYQTSKGKDVVQQIYNYMGVNELRYGILTTYDNHWFLRREHTELWISKTLPLQSESPPVLKAYAYLTRQAKENPKSRHPQVSSTVANQQSSSNTSVDQQNYSFTDFKFKGILGEGRSGKTLLCEFRDEMIALKSVDLSKAPSYVLEEMQKEVKIYKDLADIQGKYIPKLICYGYYGGGMSFVIGMTIVGTTLTDRIITKKQRSRAIKGLEAIHKKGILHNDIREENILINDNGDVYLIDFGMASQVDSKKKRNLFDQETLELSSLLDRYTFFGHPARRRISKLRNVKMLK